MLEQLLILQLKFYKKITTAELKDYILTSFQPAPRRVLVQVVRMSLTSHPQFE